MGASTAGLTVLLTNLCMDWPSGTVVYTRDLALELQRLGHRPIVYTWLKGRAARELEAAGVQVVSDLWRIHARPDVIHGHHRPLVRGALLRFPGVPAAGFCHNARAAWDAHRPGWRARNVGLAALIYRVTPNGIERALSACDPAEAARVSDLVRMLCGLELAVADLVAVYEQVIAEAGASSSTGPYSGLARRSGGHRLAVIRYRAAKAPTVAFYRVFGFGPRRVPAPMKPAYWLGRAGQRR